MTSLLAASLLSLTVMQSPAAVAAGSQAVTARAQHFLASMAAGEHGRVEEHFTNQMQAAMPPGRLGSTWESLSKQLGGWKSCGSNVRVREIADKRMVITRCEFAGGAIDVQFAFDSAGRVSGLALRPAGPAAVAHAPPAYANPGSYEETPATVGSGEWELPATLTLPAGTARVPAVVLVHGSGPNDRDETIGATKPFRDLATGLGSRGIAVLRYDKRTRVHGAKFSAVKDVTVRHAVIDDALEAVKLLRGHPRIDPGHIFVLGHSLGGMLLPRVAAGDARLAGLIVLAGAARPLEDAIVAQSRYLAAADGTISPEEQQRIDEAAALAASIRALGPADAGSGRTIGGAPASYWLDLRGYDAPSAAAATKAPMLVLQGERDYQVTTEEFGRWKQALGSRQDVTFRSYPALNHLFVAGTGPSLPAEYMVPGHVAEQVVRDIADWVLARR